MDFGVFYIVVWIVVGGQYYGQCMVIGLDDFCIGQLFFGIGQDQIQCLCVQMYYQNLIFWVVEVDIVFDQLCFVVLDYQIGIKYFLKWCVMCGYFGDGWVYDVGYYLFLNGFCQYWCGGIGFYVVGIWFGIVFVDVFVVLCCVDGQVVYIVVQDEEVGFFVGYEFFDDYFGFGIVECVVKGFVDGGDCFFFGYCNGYVFVGGQFVGFDDDWCVGFVDMCLCGFGGIEVCLCGGGGFVGIVDFFGKVF